MNRTLEDLAVAFGECRLQTPTGRLFKPAAPVDLAHALGGRVAGRLLRDRLQPIIDFALSTPHLAASTAVGLLPIGDRSGFLCMRRAGAPTQVLAAVVTKRMETPVSVFFVDLLGSNGHAYGVRALEHPPVFIANRSPELLRHAFVLEGFTAWMRWAERHGVDPWPVLQREVAERWGRGDWDDLSNAARRRSLVRLSLAIAYVERPAAMPMPSCSKAPKAR
jgi:hypothetical protein